MAKKKSGNELVTFSEQELAQQISGAVSAMIKDERVTKFSVTCNKKNELARYTASTSDGETVTRIILGAGLRETTTYDAKQASNGDRDGNIIRLLNRGLSQTEVATRMGISQALVSKVYRASL